MTDMRKYPRTAHLEGSRLQPGDDDLAALPFKQIAGRPLVVEEKLDGANAALSFDAEGALRLQSRGHYLAGGRREKHFALFKAWASSYGAALWERLGRRYVVFGEWLYAKHTIFYDALPHFFLEFDVLDREQERFLSTPRRRELLDGLPLRSVPVLWRGTAQSLHDVTTLVTRSLYKTSQWKERLAEKAAELGLSVEQVMAETDMSEQGEGLYIKVEEQGAVTQRLKWVRASFLTTVVDSGSHWLDRPVLPNDLASEVDIFGQDAGK